MPGGTEPWAGSGRRAGERLADMVTELHPNLPLTQPKEIERLLEAHGAKLCRRMLAAGCTEKEAAQEVDAMVTAFAARLKAWDGAGGWA